MIQTTNIRRILDRVMRHKMMRDIPFETAVEYAVDFISLMGTPALYEEKTAIVPVEEWRGQLPCDFEHMIQVRVAPKQKTSVVTVKSDDEHFHPHYNPSEGDEPEKEGGSEQTFVVKHLDLPFGGTYRKSGNSFHMSPNKGFADGMSLTYKIQGLVIFTSTRDIDVEIAYRAFAMDDEGYPLLPDNPSFLRGLEAFIKMKWFEMKFEEGSISQAVMERTDKEYCWAAGDAQSEFSRLTLDEAETLFNSFKTLLPRNNEHWKGFFTNGAKEFWKTH